MSVLSSHYINVLLKLRKIFTFLKTQPINWMSKDRNSNFRTLEAELWTAPWIFQEKKNVFPKHQTTFYLAVSWLPRHCFCSDLIYNLRLRMWGLLTVDSTQCWHWHSCPSPHSISGTFPSEEDRKVFAVIRYFWFWLMSGGRLHLSFFLWSFDGIRWATLVFTFHLSCFRFVTDDRIPESKLSRDLLLAVVCPTSVHTVHFPIRKFQISLQDWRTVCLVRNWWVLGVRADLTLNILTSNPTTSRHK